MNIAAEPLTENRAASAPQAPSLSLVITSLTGGAKLRQILDRVGNAAQSGDEIVVLAAAGGEEEHAECRRVGARLVCDRGASVFGLRARIPEIARKDWILLVEDHASPEPQTIEALRKLVRQKPEIDIVPLLSVNGGPSGPWGWASFLQTYASFWPPLPHAPPFCAPNNLAIRRDAIMSDSVLRLGQWEFDLVPQIYARGKIGWSNALTVIHEKPVGALAACLLHYRNGRTSAGVARELLRLSQRVMLREVRKVMAERLPATQAEIEPRLSELPRGTMRRLTILSSAHALGWAVGTWFGAGRALTKID